MTAPEESVVSVLDRVGYDFESAEADLRGAGHAADTVTPQEAMPEAIEPPILGAKAIYFDDRAVLNAVGNRFNIRGEFAPAGTDGLRQRQLGRSALLGIKY